MNTLVQNFKSKVTEGALFTWGAVLLAYVAFDQCHAIFFTEPSHYPRRPGFGEEPETDELTLVASIFMNFRRRRAPML